jgi:predicted enzyme related to lactoylglutathione lyase
MDKVVHFEIPVDDEARAKGFYAAAFDWELNTVDMGGGSTYTTSPRFPSMTRCGRRNPARSTAA